MGLPRPPGSPITHPSARHQPLQTDPEATETTQPDHTPAAASTFKGSSSASGRSAPTAPAWERRSPVTAIAPSTARSTTSWINADQAPASQPTIGAKKGEAMKVHRSRILAAIGAGGAVVAALSHM